MIVLVAGAGVAVYASTSGGDADRVEPAVQPHALRSRVERESNGPLDPLRGSSAPRVVPGRVLGHSVDGRRIELTAFGNPRSRRRLLVVGCIHGNECAGSAIVRRLTKGCPPRRADVWALDNLNPDGLARGSRLNGRGVDLNRNFPSGWHPAGRRWDPEYSGPRPLSEPETRIARKLIRLLRPQITIWFHQQAQPMVRAWGRSVPFARRFARLAGLSFHRLPWLAGTAPNWQNHRFKDASSFVVELSPGRLDRRESIRYAAAIEQLAGYAGENRISLEGARLAPGRG